MLLEIKQKSVFWLTHFDWLANSFWNEQTMLCYYLALWEWMLMHGSRDSGIQPQPRPQVLFLNYADMTFLGTDLNKISVTKNLLGVKSLGLQVVYFFFRPTYIFCYYLVTCVCAQEWQMLHSSWDQVKQQHRARRGKCLAIQSLKGTTRLSPAGT